MATVNLEAVTKNYGQQAILSEINLSIEKGEFIAVVGPSGCGKSTLLRLVSGLETLSSGRILINNLCVNSIPPAKRDIAMVFQSFALYPHMTVFDNMAYGLKMRKMKAQDIKSRVESAAKMLHLSEFLKRKPQELSGGQRQRVAMGRAIVRSPALFLFDEPLSNLDGKLRNSLRHEIRKLHKELQSTCLYVTHDQTEAMTLASRIVILNQGKIEQIAKPKILYEQPASIFVASFTGLYPMNFFRGKIDAKLGKIISPFPWVFPELPKFQEDKELVLGIRPEHFIIKESNHERAFPVIIEFIDDLGSEKLIQAKSHCGQYYFSLKIQAELEIKARELWIEPLTAKISLFDKKTGLRIGSKDAE